MILDIAKATVIVFLASILQVSVFSDVASSVGRPIFSW